MGAVESLPLWKGGTIHIELEENNATFAPGSVIKGIVHMDTKYNFPATKLELGLFATERGRFYRKNNGNRNKIEMVGEFINDYNFTLDEFQT